MTVDYIISSLPALTFGEPPQISWERFSEIAGKYAAAPAEWKDLETQLKNAIALQRGGAKWTRPADGCSIFWRNRIAQAFQEKSIAKREEMIDRVWWDAAAELTDVASPLGKGALATYAVRLKIAVKRAKISAQSGNEAFDRLTAETKISF
ncbi:MAG: hypothetical protein J6S30_01665 [Kiritimatiellae bacterium]|nr:hypothetical protein [Kiritimatiellia bacterium]